MKYSAIICTYNPKPEWIERAVQSCLGLFDEIIIVDDGSTPHILHVWEGRQVIIRRHLENKGLHEAKNTGVREATGDVICFLDDDDYFDVAGVQKLKEFMDDYSNADIVSFQLKEFGSSNGIYAPGSLNELDHRNSIPGVSWFYKTVWEELGGFSYPLAEDWDFWYRARKAGYTFENFPYVVYNYQRRVGSRSNNWGIDMQTKMAKEIKERNQ